MLVNFLIGLNLALFAVMIITFVCSILISLHMIVDWLEEKNPLLIVFVIIVTLIVSMAIGFTLIDFLDKIYFHIL